mmetsp:Transcript_21273/g.50573  ORF Transcript_21273/g.50573 Transcript_21273/m.50573 type:complete len:142 (+) Transcript_21273:472-897(+)
MFFIMRDMTAHPRGLWEHRVLDFLSNIPQYLMTMVALYAFRVETVHIMWTTLDGYTEKSSHAEACEASLDAASLILCNFMALYLMPRWCYLIVVLFLEGIAAAGATSNEVSFLLGFAFGAIAWWYLWKKLHLGPRPPFAVA